MKRPRERGEDLRLWGVVAATVRPLPGRTHPVKPAAPRPAPTPPSTPAPPPHHPLVVEPARRPARRVEVPPQTIEPGRHRRLVRGRDAIGAVIDLHGLTYDAARATLIAFVERAHREGERAILVITGKGALGDGVLRRHVPDWLAEPPLRRWIAGVSEAHRHHGGAGALYVALRR